MSNNSVSNFMKVSELYFKLNEAKNPVFNVDKPSSISSNKRLTLNKKRQSQENTSAM